MPAHSPSAQAVIQVLPTPTQSKLRSTQILTSLPQLVSELVQNSLDANARQVDIGVDCEEWECWVRDDGVGMRKDGLAKLALGLKAGRYNTSKAYTTASLEEVTTFGFRGEALASAADVSCIEISSRTARSRDSWSIILKDGNCLYNGPSIRWRRESHGTVVSIRDAFYNLPIRRRSHPASQKTIASIRRAIEAYALAFPEVSFTLEETKKIKYGHAERAPHRVLTVPKTQSIVSTFRNLYGRALAEHVDNIHEVRNGLRIDGFISLEGAQSKSHQFLYINQHPLASCDLHRIIENKFASSSFSKHAFDEHGEMSQPRSTVRRSPRKSEKKPVFVLNLTVPRQQVDNCLEPAKSTVHFRDPSTVSAFLSSVVQAFLVRHGFATATTARCQRPIITKNGQADPPSPRKRKKLHSDDFEPPTRGGLRTTVQTQDSPVIVDEQDDNGITLAWTDSHTGIRYTIDKRTGNSYRLDNTTIEDSNSGDQDWDESTILQASERASRRTIGIRRLRQENSVNSATPEWISKALKANRAYALTERKIPSVVPVPFPSPLFPKSSQIQHGLCRHDHASCPTWHDVASLPWDDNNVSVQRRLEKGDLDRARVVGQVDRKFIACITERPGETGDGQAERSEKDAGATLILIDQHAADERVRVERFLKKLCDGFLRHDQLSSALESPLLSQSTSACTDADIADVLDPPVPVLLTRREAAHIVKSDDARKVLERWGVAFVGLDRVKVGEAEDRLDEVEDELDILTRWRTRPRAGGEAAGESEKEKGHGYSQVMVKSVPALLRDKLLMDDELRDLIKSALVHLETVGYPSSGISCPSASQPLTTHQETSTAPWQRALRWCPPHLLGLINSKACRGAIMFNDPLTLEQCERLVSQLCGTDAPFMCAHGRPSLVPLLEVGVGKDAKHEVRKKGRSKVNWAIFAECHPTPAGELDEGIFLNTVET